ncbi:MAG: hypothetical protein M1274_00340 [Actinobacteria bacterium]|nr:hypothetical protein [Actinomycetota bacterium]
MNSLGLSDPASTGVRALIERGVVVHCPASVYVEEDVDARRVAPGVVIHPGCRLRGAGTSIGPGSVLGEEAPVTVETCRLGRDVFLKGGYFAGSTFLDGAKVGSGAHVRPGTLLEEGASAAYCVGLKQTVLFPFVTIGSLVNFCDCLMSGGTGPKDHSEVGSSYIHFNFTPHQDKATASLVGDVPGGVMLDKVPIFLGGQGGLVGPARLAFGTVVAAGVICRHDVLEEGLLYTGRATPGSRTRPVRKQAHVGLARLFRNNFHYLGNVRALQAWYRIVRRRLMVGDPYQEACWEGAMTALDTIVTERLLRLGELAHLVGGRSTGSLSESATGDVHEMVEAYHQLRDAWPDLASLASAESSEDTGSGQREVFLSEWEKVPVLTPYPEAIATLTQHAKAAGTAWLRAVVDDVVTLLPKPASVVGKDGH